MNKGCGSSEAYPNATGWEDLFPIDQEDTQRNLFAHAST